MLQSQKIFYDAKGRFLHLRGFDSAKIFKVVAPEKNEEKTTSIVKYNKNFKSTSVDFVSIRLEKMDINFHQFRLFINIFILLLVPFGRTIFERSVTYLHYSSISYSDYGVL